MHETKLRNTVLSVSLTHSFTRSLNHLHLQRFRCPVFFRWTVLAFWSMSFEIGMDVSLLLRRLLFLVFFTNHWFKWMVAVIFFFFFWSLIQNACLLPMRCPHTKKKKIVTSWIFYVKIYTPTYIPSKICFFWASFMAAPS